MGAIVGIGKLGLDIVEALGFRGTDGLPYAFKVLQATAQLALGRKWTHGVGGSVIALHEAAKPATRIYATLAAPFVDLAKVRKYVGVWIRNLQSQADFVTILTNSVKTSIFFFAYLCSLSQAAEEVIHLRAWPASESVTTVLSKITFVTGSLFATLALVGTGLKLIDATRRWMQVNPKADATDHRFAQVHFKHAFLGFLKTAAKIALVVGAGYFSLTTQAIVGFCVVASEIYVKRHKAELKRPDRSSLCL